MAVTKAVLVLLCVHTLRAVLAQEQNRFVVSPSDKIVTLNSSAVFLCRFRGETVTGIVEERRVEDRDDVAVISGEYDFQPPYGTFDFAMRLNASEANNNSEIWCQGRGPDVNSSRARLIVQGTLAAPGNLSAEAINDTAISLNWSPPFTLDITDVDPDISNYTVYISNTITGVNDTRFGIVDTSLIFSGISGEGPNSCHNYRFSVSANNVVGEGEWSGEVFQRFEGECPDNIEKMKKGKKKPWWLRMIVGIAAAIILCVILYCCWRSRQDRNKDCNGTSQQVTHDGGTDQTPIDLSSLDNSNSSSGAGNDHNVSGPSVADGGVTSSFEASHNLHQANGNEAEVTTQGGPLRLSFRVVADGETSCSEKEIGAHSPRQEDENEAEDVHVPLGGPIPPPGMQQKGVSGHGLRRRRLKDYLHSEPELIDFKELVATTSEKWRELGLELKLSRTSLDKIANRATSPEKRFIAVFEELTKKSVTWEEIIQALGSPRVGESTLAGLVKDRLTYYK